MFFAGKNKRGEERNVGPKEVNTFLWVARPDDAIDVP